MQIYNFKLNFGHNKVAQKLNNYQRMDRKY
jgi:hypothetical protein